MTEEEYKIKEKIKKVVNLKLNPGNKGEELAAKAALKRLEEKLKDLKKEKKTQEKEEISLYKIKFKNQNELELFSELCYNYKIGVFYPRRSKGFTLKVEAKKSQVDILMEIVSIIEPRFTRFQSEAYNKVHEAYKEYLKEIREYRKNLLNANFSDPSTYDPSLANEIDSKFESENDEEDVFTEWD